MQPNNCISAYLSWILNYALFYVNIIHTVQCHMNNKLPTFLDLDSTGFPTALFMITYEWVHDPKNERTSLTMCLLLAQLWIHTYKISVRCALYIYQSDIALAIPYKMLDKWYCNVSHSIQYLNCHIRRKVLCEWRSPCADIRCGDCSKSDPRFKFLVAARSSADSVQGLDRVYAPSF